MRNYIMSGLVAASVVVLMMAPVVSAHVVVRPAQVSTASYQVFIVSVPNERPLPTTEVRLVIPEELSNVTPTAKAGWDIQVERDGQSDTARIVSITWQDGEIADGLRDEFTFSAKTPDVASQLEWKAYQTYSDGVTVSWDEENSEHGHDGDATSGPFSVTTVDEGAAEENIDLSNSNTSDWALYVSGAALLVSLSAFALMVGRKK